MGSYLLVALVGASIGACSSDDSGGDDTTTSGTTSITIDGSGAINIKANRNVVIKGQKILQN